MASLRLSDLADAWVRRAHGCPSDSRRYLSRFGSAGGPHFRCARGRPGLHRRVGTGPACRGGAGRPGHRGIAGPISPDRGRGGDLSSLPDRAEPARTDLRDGPMAPYVRDPLHLLPRTARHQLPGDPIQPRCGRPRTAVDPGVTRGDVAAAAPPPGPDADRPGTDNGRRPERALGHGIRGSPAHQPWPLALRGPPALRQSRAPIARVEEGTPERGGTGAPWL